MRIVLLRLLGLLLVVMLLGAVPARAQQPSPEQGPGRSPAPQRGAGPMPAQGPMRPNRPPMERMFQAGPPGRWWTDASLVERLGLTGDQQKKMEALFQQDRLKLIDLSAVLQREEAIMEPLLETDRPEEAKVLSQIDRVAQARAELEKANARMLLGFRTVLSQDQWKKLQAEGRPAPPRDNRR
jgi:periplasmic protein CpxP/Spy